MPNWPAPFLYTYEKESISYRKKENEMLKSYFDLSEDLKERARELHPNDYEKWSYKIIGVNIEFSCM